MIGTSVPIWHGRRRALVGLLAILGVWSVSACAGVRPARQNEAVADGGPQQAGPLAETSAPPQPPALQPVTLWRDGKPAGEIDLAQPHDARIVVLDLGEDWTPYIFTERSNPDDKLVPQSYRATYLALARGEFPHDHHGKRAKRDRYLELYGIPPTLTLLRTRLREDVSQDCASRLDLEPLGQGQRFLPYLVDRNAQRDSKQFLALEERVKQLMAKQGVDAASKLDASRLSAIDRATLKQYEKTAPMALLVRAAQARLACEGFYAPNVAYTDGALDWVTSDALALFERKHRVFGWGVLGRDSVEALKQPPLEGERQAVLRVLTERGMHAGGFLEDGSPTNGSSDKPRTFVGADGKEHPVPNLEQEVEGDIVKAFGLQTPESTLAWLESLGALSGNKLVAIEGPEAPEYYSPNMDLSVVIDRGDVWYEFPYDDQGHERFQPVQRRPTLTVYTDYLGQKITLARYGTTVGGWRTELVDGVEMWQYKGSPVGPRVWRQIVSAPVWLAPPGTPVKTLVTRDFNSKTGYSIDWHELGPSYASAYGLVAAYHSRFKEGDDGEVELQGDEGIRTHGSVDYMSIMDRHSHGCHRLHNHIAVRLMSFVLAHRPHTRLGETPIAYKNTVKNNAESPPDDSEYVIEIKKTGYAFRLDRPVPVEVVAGHIVGRRRTPITTALPKYDETKAAYVMPDGSTVRVDRMGEVTPIASPPPDAGAPAPSP
ncbi:MAG TPA: hypothetical protein VKU41_12805 [Polyangiaceae bacterium]|nr:hypothetical protein [Polyangiaceae bacterium]